MRNLTETEIRDLESRGIKPGVLLHCAYNPSVKFIFNDWSEFESDEDEISSKETKDGYYDWLKTHNGEYATPVEQPNTVRPVFEAAPIDWEQRRWELARAMYVNYPESSASAAIESTDDFIREYRNTPQPALITP